MNRRAKHLVTALLVVLAVSCGTTSRHGDAANAAGVDAASGRASVLSISDLLSRPHTFDGHTITVEGAIRDTGAHGMFILDPHDPNKGMDLLIGNELQDTESLRKITEMLIADRSNEPRREVVADLTGTFVWKPKGASTLTASRVDHLRWGVASQD